MDIRVESELFNDSESDSQHRDETITEENLHLIDETISNVSRNMRKGDWTYLCRHPEVRAIIRVIITEAIKTHPKNIYTFAADLFHCTNHRKITKKINKQLKWMDMQLKSGTWASAEGPMNFPESSSCSTLKNTECEQTFNKDTDKEAALDDLYLKQHMCPDNYKPSC